MKRAERHRLKENELAASVARAREALERHRGSLALALVALLVVGIAVAGYTLWRARQNAQASARLAEGMTILEAPVTPPPAANTGANPQTPAPAPAPGSYPSERAKLEAALPKLMEAADAYPSTPAGIAARYHAATTLALLGRFPEAEQRYNEVINRATSGLYGEMAKLGLAELEARAGKYDAAIQTWKDVSTRPTGEIPVDGALMQLGRAYTLAGKSTEAAQAFNRIVQEFPDSPYATAARQELDSLKTSGRN